MTILREHVARRIHVDVVPLEARSIQGRRAGLITRVIANVVDLGVVIAVVFGLYIVWAGVKLLWQGAAFTRPTPGFGAALLVATLVQILYFAASWTTSGRTYGDQLMGLRVFGRRADRLRVAPALVRAVLCAVFPFGLLWAGISKEHRSVQDLVLRSSVIYDWHVRTDDDEMAGVSDRSGDALGSRVDVQPTITDETDDGHPEPLPRLNGE